MNQTKVSPTDDPVVIVAAQRTPLGHFNGYFKTIACTHLGAAAISACASTLNLEESPVDEVIMGCVLPAGLGQAPARQAALAAGLPVSTPCTTINKVCGSGMKAIMLAHDLLLAHSAKTIIAGGMENMSRAPYLLPKARSGYRLGHGEVIDHMMRDGLEDAYQSERPMGYFAELCAQQYQITRKQQDNFARSSLLRAQQATTSQHFQTEIVPITVTSASNQQKIVNQDEGPLTARPERIASLKPAFMEHGTITAAHSSSIADGAAAILLMRLSDAIQYKQKPLALFIGHATHAQASSQFTTAPIHAIRRLLDKIGWRIGDVELWEINEAFAVVTMLAIQELNLDPDLVNLHGGACALGHPLGASGARILVTLLHAMQQQQKKRGVAVLCIGGGEATAVAVECCF